MSEEEKAPTQQSTLVEKARLLSTSDLLPLSFKGKPGNILLAIELAQDLQVSPFTLMNNVNIIHGKFTFSSTFLLALLRKSDLFTTIDFLFSDNNKACKVKATRKDQTIVEGPEVSLNMASQEGWSTKAGSKWKTMPELMLRYRAAAFFVRSCVPELLFGLQTMEEVEDVAFGTSQAPATRAASPTSSLSDLLEKKS